MRIFTPRTSHLKILFLLSLIFHFGRVEAQTTLIPPGSAWDYYDSGNEPAVQSSIAWYENNYNSSSWSSGNAHLGYGDGDETTTISSATYTAYVRHSFSSS